MTQFMSDGVFSTCFGASVSFCSPLPSHPYITDYGASHHMTGMSSIFSSIVFLLAKARYVLPMAPSTITDTDSTPSMPLSFVFHVLNF